MAEKLLQSIARGTYKATTEPIKQASSAAARSALDPIMFRSLYKAGIIGPLLKSIVSEYKKPDKKDSKGRADVGTDGVIVSNISRSLQSMSNQLSAITDVMEDIRNLTRVQLKIDEKTALQAQRLQRRGEAEAIEEKLEAIKPSASGLMDKTIGGMKQQGLVGKMVGGLLGFVKDNPIISAIVGAGLIASSETLKKFVQDFREQSGIDEDIEKASKTLKETVGGVVKKGLESIEEAMREMLSDIPLIGKVIKKPEGTQQEKTPISSGLSNVNVGGAALGFMLGRLLPFGLGRFGGIAGAIAGGTESTLGESALSALGIIGAVKALSMVGKSAISKGGSWLSGKMGMGAATGAATAGSVPPIEVAKQSKPLGRGPVSSKVNIPVGPQRANLSIASQSKEKFSVKVIIDKMNLLTRKIGWTALMNLLLPKLAAVLPIKIGAGLSGFIAGPFGLITTVLAAGGTLFVVYQILTSIEEEVDNLEQASKGMPSGPVPEMVNATQTSLKPRASSLFETPMNEIGSESYEEYKSKVMRLESGGQNIPAAAGGTAFGLYQINRKTFEGLRQKDPSLKNVTFEEMKADTGIQQRAFDALTKDNIETLVRSGISPTPFNLYLAHRLGAEGAIRILKADSSANLINTAYMLRSDEFKDEVRRLNPDMVNKSVGQFLNERAKAFGGATPIPFKTTQATPEKSREEEIEKIIGLSAFVRAAEMIKPLIIDASQNTNTTTTAKNSTSNQSAPTISPYHHSKQEVREEFLRWEKLRY